MTTHESDGVTVARILRPHGRRGEVAAEILTDFPERLTQLSSAELFDVRPTQKTSSQKPSEESLRKSDPRRVPVRSCWLSQSRGGQAIFHFEGSDSISDAEKLVGLEIRIPLLERTQLPAGTYYIDDLAGCEVIEKNGAAIGCVRDVQATGEGIAGTPILIVDSPNGELLIPLAQDICVQVDTNARRIEVVLPEGLLDLNS